MNSREKKKCRGDEEKTPHCLQIDYQFEERRQSLFVGNANSLRRDFFPLILELIRYTDDF